MFTEGQFGPTHSVYYDHRVEDGKIAEHWNVIEAIPPKAKQKNGNGKF
jgi:predicted SnoaL-like aldol condensation-catalyzing enzyme